MVFNPHDTSSLLFRDSRQFFDKHFQERVAIVNWEGKMFRVHGPVTA
jgi:hypothetical protein